MRKHLACLVALAFVLSVTAAMAQTSATGGQQQTTTTTTTTQQTTTSTGTEHTVEGCLAKEGSDFFLIPSHGTPIELQASAGQDLTAHEGHKVKVHGVESSLSASAAGGTAPTGGAAGAATTTSTSTTATGAQSSTRSVTEPAGSTASSNAGTTSGTGNDLHRLAAKQMTVSNLDHVADTCPVNWNPNVPSKPSSKQ